MTTLNQREGQDVLFRLYAEAQTNDSKIQAEEQALLADAGDIIDDQTLQSINDRTFVAVAPEVGRLIYSLVRTRRPALVVEFGTSFGLSAIHTVWQVDKDGLHRHPLVRWIMICVATIQIPSQHTLSLIRRIQIVTITWMSIEAVLSLWSGWKATSPVLAAFGGDSAIELLSAIMVLWRFRDEGSTDDERRAARMTGGLLIVLGACVVLVSSISLLGYSEPKPSYFGMVVLLAALLIMPLLAREKRRLSAITGSAALRADSAQSGLCAYLSLIALLGLGVRSVWHIEWADPVAALAIIPFILFEAREALKGKACRCC